MTARHSTRGAAAVACCLIACGVPRPAARPEAVFGRTGDAAAVRAAVLVAHLTLAEKVAQLQNATPAIPRLGIPAYDWWSESLHGVARAGLATVFPQAIALAATFDEDLVRRVGEAIAEEGRAKFAALGGAGTDADPGSGQYRGLSFFAPNINIFRDPRWGRGQETFGEDPFLTARLAVAYVRGLQGDDPRRLRVAAVAKHFAVHSGPERERHGFDARVDAHDLADSYLPQFEAVVREGGVAGIMAAYNRINGTPCVTNAGLLGNLLRRTWGFEGFVVGDCGAIEDVYRSHHGPGDGIPDGIPAAAAALHAGTDLDCGKTYRHLAEAVRSGVVAEAELDRALIRLFAVRFRLALFDGQPSRPTSTAVASSVAPDVSAMVDGHRALAREAARRSIVLLRNDGVLPLGSGVRRLAVLGPTGDDLLVLLGNYHGTPRAPVTLRAGLAAAARARGIVMTFLPAVALDGHRGSNLAAAEAMARQADVVVLCLGLSPRLESEEGDPESENPRGDREELGLPGLQPLLLRRLLAIGRPVVVVLTGGSAVVLPADTNPAAVLMAWYPGQEGGNAVADVIFGVQSPSGRLPITFYRDARDLPPFTDYAMRGRTYRYFAGQVAYPFGHGLGYSEVIERDVTAAAQGPGGAVRVTVNLDNRGRRTVERTVLVYAELVDRVPSDPLRSLVSFRRVTAPAGVVIPLTFEVAAAAFQRVDAAGVRRPVPGPWRLWVGDAPPVAVEVLPLSTL